MHVCCAAALVPVATRELADRAYVLLAESPRRRAVSLGLVASLDRGVADVALFGAALWPRAAPMIGLQCVGAAP